MAYQVSPIPAPGRISRAPGGPFGLSGVQWRETNAAAHWLCG